MTDNIHKVDISWEKRPSGNIAHVVYDNSRRLNVVGPPGLLDLTEAFMALSREDDLRCVVFSGAGGRAFIGGADINHMAGMKKPDDGRRFITVGYGLAGLGKVIVAASVAWPRYSSNVMPPKVKPVR